MTARSAKIAKGEFETTAAFQARASIAAKVIAPEGDLTILWPAHGFAYDADSEIVTYPRYDFNMGCSANPKDASYATGRPICIEQDQASTSHREIKSTAMGARAVVQVIHQNRVGLALGSNQSKTLFGYELTNIFRFSASPTNAKSLKENGVFVLRGMPRQPFFVTASHYSEPTLDSPVEVYGEDALLVFRLDCLSIADGKTGEVFETVRVHDPDEETPSPINTPTTASRTVRRSYVSPEDIRTGKVKVND
ncbi:hypothetical protein [Sphingomonas bacterium]|uniref:hypothetical protein n=1 Tax=Sphingomonas bacterium TaxID=1895847 RepID=UPI001575A8E1|nr:hypothetical protein [Sphingomonas bacterium]